MIYLLIFIIGLCLTLVFVFLAKNRYEKSDLNGDLKKRKSSELLERIEDAKNLMQIDKARLDLETADISNITKECLYILLEKRRDIIRLRQQKFDLNEDSFYEGGYNRFEDNEVLDLTTENGTEE